MGKKTAENYVNYQERATEFSVGDLVVPYGHYDALSGRVTAVWPAIGMVDVEFVSGNKRYPVEDVVRIDEENTTVLPPTTDSTPGGQPTVSVPGGPLPQKTAREGRMAQRVAEAYVKKALYWAAPDRQYRAPSSEVVSGRYTCPKCRARGIESFLRPAAYKRREGVSERLLGCPSCVFLIKKVDIINCPDNQPVEV